MNAIFLLAGVAQLAIAVFALRSRQRNPLAAVLLAVLGAAIAYDNLVVGLGSTIGEGDLLETLSWGRFALHNLLTPLFLLVAAGLLGQHRTRTRTFTIPVMGAVAAVLVLFGVTTDLIGLELAVEVTGDVVRYADAEASAPIATIVTILLVNVMGFRLLRSGGPRWLFVGAVVMLVTGAAPTDGAPVLGNLGEVALLTGALLTLTSPASTETADGSAVASPSIQSGA